MGSSKVFDECKCLDEVKRASHSQSFVLANSYFTLSEPSIIIILIIIIYLIREYTKMIRHGNAFEFNTLCIKFNTLCIKVKSITVSDHFRIFALPMVLRTFDA